MSTSAQRVCRLAQEAAEADDSLTALETLVELRRELVSGFRPGQSGVRELLREATRRAVSRGERWLDVTGLLLAALTGPDGGARRVLTALGLDAFALRVRLERDERPRQHEVRAR